MKLYVFDISSQIESSNPEEDFRSQLIYMHKYLFRGVTNSFSTMRLYLSYMTDLIGQYVTFQIFEYKVSDRELNEDQLSRLALTLYNEDKDRVSNDIANMPILYTFSNDTKYVALTSSHYAVYKQHMFNKLMFVDVMNETLRGLGIAMRYSKSNIRDKLSSLFSPILSDEYNGVDVLDEVYLLDAFMQSFDYIT